MHSSALTRKWRCTIYLGMAKSINPEKSKEITAAATQARMQFSRWTPEEIVVPDRLRKGIREDAVITLMTSIREIGLREPPTIQIDKDKNGGEYPILIAGRHRVEACKRLGIERIDCVVFDGDEIDARLWEIAENLHRAELTELEWSEHVAEWKRLAEQKEVEGISEQNVQKIAKDGTARGRPEGGTARAARELPIPGPTEDAKRMAVTRAIKIANIPAEAKEVVKAAGLADNQSALLAVARAEPKDQVRVLEEIAQRKTRQPAPVDRQVARLMAAWNAAGEEARGLFLEHVDQGDVMSAEEAEEELRSHGVPQLIAKFERGEIDAFEGAIWSRVRKKSQYLLFPNK
jgi:ParB-like chromosome segregation protein Spo0J